MRFRKKPVEIEAIRWTGHNIKELQSFIGSTGVEASPNRNVYIATREGIMAAMPGDWIIREPFPAEDREFYPCKHDIFIATYEPIGDENE